MSGNENPAATPPDIPIDLPVSPPPPSLRPRPVGAPGSAPSRPPGVDPVVDCAVYVDGKRHAPPVAAHDSLRVATENGGFVWLGLYEPSEEELTSIAER
jgi:magnesium transporter